jgi:hypothetical protein
MDSNVPFNAAAVLVWLPDDARPTVDAFDPEATAGTDIEPRAYWLLSQAITEALAEKREGQKPWIKAAEALLNEEQMRDMAGAARALWERRRSIR